MSQFSSTTAPHDPCAYRRGSVRLLVDDSQTGLLFPRRAPQRPSWGRPTGLPISFPIRCSREGGRSVLHMGGFGAAPARRLAADRDARALAQLLPHGLEDGTTDNPFERDPGPTGAAQVPDPGGQARRASATGGCSGSISRTVGSGDG